MIKHAYFFFLLSCTGLHATDYYISSSGADSRSGTSPQEAWQTLHKASSAKYKAGDRIILSSSGSLKGELRLESQSGSKEAPITIMGFDHKKPAKIDASQAPNGITLIDCNHIAVQNLEISANPGSSSDAPPETDMRCGILITTRNPGEYSGFTINNVTLKDIFFHAKGYSRPENEVRTPNGSQPYGWGFRAICKAEQTKLKDISISHCHIENIAHTGIKFTSGKQSIENIKVFDNQVLKTGGPGIQFSGVKNGYVHHNTVNFSGSSDDNRKWGRGSGLWTFGSSRFVIEHNEFLNASGPGDSAGAHIDYNCDNVVMQYNFSKNNAGGFIEILGNNHQCAYRYNISINDGHREKGKNGAFQEGKTIWLSGYNGKNPRTGPFNTYIYNNTIVTSKEMVAKFALDRKTSGALIANNIFYIQGKSKAVRGDQYTPETDGAWETKNILLQNNLFLTAGNWPHSLPASHSKKLVGNPMFRSSSFNQIKDLIPTNSSLIKDKGITPTLIPGDKLGIFIGLPAKTDILGRKINGNPDLGAIELP